MGWQVGLAGASAGRSEGSVLLLLGVSTKVLLLTVATELGGGSLTGERGLVMSTLLLLLLVGSLVVIILLLMLLLSVSSGSLVVVAAGIRVDVGAVLRSLRGIAGDQLEGLLDLSWDRWGSGQVGAHRLVSVLVSRVRDGVVLAIVTGVGIGALDGGSSVLAVLSLGVGGDSVSSLVATGDACRGYERVIG